jgi:hypothetical protein
MSFFRILKPILSYLLTSRTVDLRIENSRQPWTLMVEDDTFIPEWLILIKKYPTRFILAFDNVWDWNWDESYIDAVSSWRKALSKIPPDAAEAIAYKNAKRLWNLKQRLTRPIARGRG